MSINLNKINPTKVFDTYWKFAQERQNIFFNKFNSKVELTKDEILSKHKFTNAYRASDRVSQYLIKNVIYSGDQSIDEVFFRIILFKTFNKIETWETLLKNLEQISISSFNFKRYDDILNREKLNKKPIYSGAYIMTSGKSSFGFDKKHRNHLSLLKLMLKDRLPEKISEAKNLEQVFNLLKSYPTIGDFLAYQYAIDLNYSNIINFSEMDFVVAGPGAKDGITKCFQDIKSYSFSDIIKMTCDNQNEEFSRLNIDFKNLWGRPLTLIDCQNLFCEVDKYSRVAHPEFIGKSGRSRIKQNYTPKSIEIFFWYPPKWKLNSKIELAYEQREECIYQSS
ncbi:nucleotide kinase domain-containing protein [Psychroserpens algicola]|uniref:DNA base hypermodification protein n=1 Tax=Psychroserpens algicola TaxID=1719034 RepID=A0ABT0H3W3_9FLAO|nr:nucleotide kinase domain-containing protein [Psychroserpens algicola]MCK8479069.1 putative DNA base hypermodification protein [Psychroserpens algicola]